MLVSDTVGFIKQLPHDLVASFRSTLAEALEASLLLFVVDASGPTYEAQLEVSRSVLREIGAGSVLADACPLTRVRVGAGRRSLSLGRAGGVAIGREASTSSTLCCAVHAPMAASISSTRCTRPAFLARPGSCARSGRPMHCIRRLKMLSPLPATSA